MSQTISVLTGEVNRTWRFVDPLGKNHEVRLRFLCGFSMEASHYGMNKEIPVNINRGHFPSLRALKLSLSLVGACSDVSLQIAQLQRSPLLYLAMH
jgi:hypothetical protein